MNKIQDFKQDEQVLEKKLCFFWWVWFLDDENGKKMKFLCERKKHQNPQHTKQDLTRFHPKIFPPLNIFGL